MDHTVAEVVLQFQSRTLIDRKLLSQMTSSHLHTGDDPGDPGCLGLQQVTVFTQAGFLVPAAFLNTILIHEA